MVRQYFRSYWGVHVYIFEWNRDRRQLRVTGCAISEPTDLMGTVTAVAAGDAALKPLSLISLYEKRQIVVFLARYQFI